MALISLRKAVVHPRRVPAVLIAALVLVAIVVAALYRPRLNELRVGYKADPPFAMTDTQGQRTGMAVEIFTEAAKRANIRLRWVKEEGIDEALREGKIDIFPLLALTDARQAEFHSSQVWWETEAALVSLESAPLVTSADTAGKTIAIRGFPVLRAIAERLFPKSSIISIPQTGDMVASLCSNRVEAAFLDTRYLESELMKGPAACAGRPLHITFVPGGSLSRGTVSRKEVAATADKIYEQIAVLAIDGTLSEVASRWSMLSTFQNRHMKDMLNAQERARMMRYGLLVLTLALILTWYQSKRVHRARRIAEEDRQRFDAFMKHTPAITFITDDVGRVVYVNEAISKPFELSSENVARQFNTNRSKSTRSTRTSGDETVETTETVTLPSGELRHFLCVEFPFANCSGQKLFGSVALDITERLKAEEALRLSQFSIEQSPDSILWIDSDQRIFYANRAACKALGYDREKLVGSTAGDLDVEYLRGFAAMRAKLRDTGVFSVESTLRGNEGEVVPIEVAFYFLESDGKDFTCCICRNITERKLAEQELSYQAKHDALTGLPNRRYFESELERRVAEASVDNTGLALFYFDIDGFKKINDTFGHAVGDAVLIEVARRCESCIREHETLARMGGDEFTLIAPGVYSKESAKAMADTLFSALRESFFVEGREVSVTASIGISLFPLDGHTARELLQHADAAMYEAKRQGKNRQHFFPLPPVRASRERAAPDEVFDEYSVAS